MRKNRSIILMIYDLSIVLFSYVFALFVRFDFNYTKTISYAGFYQNLIIVFLIYYAVFKLLKLNQSIWAKVSLDEGMRIIAGNLIAATLTLIFTLVNKRAIPISVIFIAFLLNTLLQEGMRFSYRLMRLTSFKNKVKKDKSLKRYLIYGAGDAGVMILREMINNDNYKGHVVGFIDDNPVLKKKTILGTPVFGDKTILKYIVNQQGIDEIIVAMPSQNIQIQKEILAQSYELGIPVKTVSSSELLLNGNPLNQVLKKVDIVDLLQRKEIVLDSEEIKNSIQNKEILVTGAGGSIGSELVRQIIKYKPKGITLYDINENSLYDIQQELLMLKRDNQKEYDTPIYAYIGSIRDKANLDRIFKHHQYNLVFHAAAHKHVPLMETSPQEAIKNNIFGTKNLIEVSKKYKVDKFINISTDKAVNPTNVMGATKRFNEMMLQSQSETVHTKFVAVRFGNVLGSNGSVIPLFRKQIEMGGPVCVTHKDITRFFMTIPEAVSLILQAETYAQGGEIFVLDMGKPVKILELAEKVITLSGFKPYEDIKIEFTGLRPGEKLYEELLMAEEGLEKTKNELIFIAHPLPTSNGELIQQLNKLKEEIAKESSHTDLLNVLYEAVPTFKHMKLK